MSKSSSIANGADIIATHVKTLPTAPGVYRMLDKAGKILYVGKAKNLKSRVAAYTKPDAMPVRLQRMIAQTTTMEFVVTHTEAEALLLESNLIKHHKPAFNILLRDDKSFAQIMLSTNHDFPRLEKHRGKKQKNAQYYGPFASTRAVNQTLTLLQRIFQLRNCTDNDFANRDRPCLQYHIKRCSAPCVGYITQTDYAQSVTKAQDFLRGKTTYIQKEFATAMQQASTNRDYEKAASLRDRIEILTTIQSHQDINIKNMGDVDIIAATQKNHQTCIQIFFYRHGRNYGNRAYFPRHDDHATIPEILTAFIGQFYENKPVPPEICVDRKLPDQKLIATALSHANQSPVKITTPQQGARKKLIHLATQNAEQALARHLAHTTSHQEIAEELMEIFNLPAPPNRIEVYDNSHISGTNAIGAMIVFAEGEFQKNAYRKFNIKTDLAPGDDVAMMREILTRRFARAKHENTPLPDLIIIDGGAGQLSAAQESLRQQEMDHLPVAAIAKGPDRNAGRERFFMPNHPPFSLPPQHPVLYFLQNLRDESHRFAIGSHRAKRAKSVTRSELDQVPAIGPKRKKQLLHHFGSVKNIASAGVKDLAQVDGISHSIAQTIYDHFHPDTKT